MNFKPPETPELGNPAQILSLNLLLPQGRDPVVAEIAHRLYETYGYTIKQVGSIEEMFSDQRHIINLFHIPVHSKVTGRVAFQIQTSVEEQLPSRLSIALFGNVSSSEKSFYMQALQIANYLQVDPTASEKSIQSCADSMVEHLNHVYLYDTDNFSIAIVDDCKYTREGLYMALSSMSNWEVSRFPSPEAFLASNDTFNLFIVDIVLEQVSGIDLIRTINRHNPNAIVIAMSQLEAPKMIHLIKQAGATEFMSKPLNMKLLARRVLSVYARAQPSFQE